MNLSITKNLPALFVFIAGISLSGLGVVAYSSEYSQSRKQSKEDAAFERAMRQLSTQEKATLERAMKKIPKTIPKYDPLSRFRRSTSNSDSSDE